mmetsp:Transcript_20079/g.17181  ORF Transcript_20079/g.17181 Transcript_20079/m.17181 type:complete len:253 (+) Transcript_20079:1-759(+)
MDTLGSLALATEAPTDDLLTRKPHQRNEYIVTKTMMKHIIGQAIYQFTIIMILVFNGEKWLPEDLPFDVDTERDKGGDPTGEYVYYEGAPCTDCDPHMRSGRAYMIDSADDDYLRFDLEYGSSRHLTVVFNAFVFMQVFNFLNARKLRDEYNVFAGVFSNWMFLAIVLFITITQVIMGQFGGRVMSVSPHGMNGAQWGICIAFGFGTCFVSLILKLIPFHKVCPSLGNKFTDPLHSESKVLSVRRSHRSSTL